MSKFEKNQEDFPLKGFLGRLVTYLVPQREVFIPDEKIQLNPGYTFTGVFKSLLKDKTFLWFLLSGYFCEAVFYTIYLTLPLVLGHFVTLLMENDAINYDNIFELCVLAISMLAVAATINIFSVRQADRTRGIAEVKSRRQLTWWTLGHSAGWFSVREAGQTAHRIAEVARQMNMIFSLLVWNVVPLLMSLGIVSIVMFFTDTYAGIFFTLWAIVFVYMSIQLGLISQKFMMRTVKRRAEASGTVTDVIINHSLVRLFDSKKQEDEKVDLLSQQCFEAFIESSTWARVKNLIRDTWIIFLLPSMIFILGHGLIEERITPAAFVGGMGTLFVLITQVRALHHIIRDFMEGVGTIREGLLEIGVEHDIEEIHVKETIQLKKKDISLEKVSFNYHPGQSILQNINLHIPENQKIGIVGSSGAGKTTLMALLLRLWDVEDGTIKIGGENIKDIPSNTLRDNMALIPQDTTMFHRSLMENIRYGRSDASDKDVIAAAKKAHAHEFISELKNGYETMVGERGVKLSGGQRQRIAIARAILKDAPILILDEATSALDSESEKLIQESLEGLMKGKTVIAIAHRLSTIAHLDRLIVMDQGKIVEDGTHKDLIEQNGIYAKLWQMQSGGFIGD